MKTYILKRLLLLIPILLIVTIMVFLIIHLTPGDPAQVILGEGATEEEVDKLHNELNLDDPLSKQYATWMKNLFKGDLGDSYFMNQSVTSAIAEHFVPTILLAIYAEVIALIIAIPIGIISAVRRGSMTDYSFMTGTLIGISIPSFLTSLFLMLLFSVKLELLPVGGFEPIQEGIWSHFKFMILPAIALGTMQAALTARMTRSSMLEVLNTNFIKTAHSKGVKERNVIYGHALRNAFLPILTVIGQSFGVLIAGAVVVETIFNIPGIGQLIINSIERRDYTVIQGVVLFITVIYVFINLVIDLLYGIIDPRVRLDQK